MAVVIKKIYCNSKAYTVILKFYSSKKYVESSTEEEDLDNDDSDGENVNVTKKKKNSNELVTVNMDDLGDLLSKPSADVYFAKKSTPSKKSDEPLTCDICDKTFKKNLNLQLHK